MTKQTYDGIGADVVAIYTEADHDWSPPTVLHAQAAAEALRAICHLTIDGDGDLAYPDQLSRTVEALSTTLYRSVQALEQLARLADTAAERGDLYDDRRPDDPTAGATLARSAGAALLAAAAEVGAAAQGGIHAATASLSHLGLRD